MMNRDMVTIPLFLLANLLTFGTISLSGCSNVPENSQDSLSVIQKDEGYLSVIGPDYPAYTLSVSYQHLNSGAYRISFTHYFMPTMIVEIEDYHVSSLTMGKDVYFQDEATGILNAYFPSFPWAQLSAILEEGELRAEASQDWLLTDWEKGRFHMQAPGYQISWISKSYQNP